MFGLTEQDLEYISKALKMHNRIEKAIIFGSRAMGNYKKGSDVDIAISGKDIDESHVAILSDALNEEYPLPYFFDIIHYESIKNQQLVEHINNIGIEIFNRKSGITFDKSS